ncbi:hypothetical protein [Bradyrhizobium sp. USDA 4520]
MSDAHTSKSWKNMIAVPVAQMQPTVLQAAFMAFASIAQVAAAFSEATESNGDSNKSIIIPLFVNHLGPLEPLYRWMRRLMVR